MESPIDTPGSDGEPRCRCGHGRDHGRVVPDRHYGPLGVLALMFGVSALPRKIAFRCSRCDQLFGETTDPELLRRFS